MTAQLSFKIDTGLSAYTVELIGREIRALANDCETLTSDDVRDRLPENVLRSLDLYRNAIGAIMKGAATQGIIAPTNSFVRTRRPEGRARMIRVWRRAA